MSDESNSILDSLVPKNKEITINIKIIDPEKAKRLLHTMYDKNVDEFGVVVTEWGFWNPQKAHAMRMESIRNETERHVQEMLKIINKTNQQIIENT